MLYARDLMTEDILSISSEVSVAEAIALMQMEKVRSLIVLDPEEELNGLTCGILTERDIVYKVIAPGLNPKSIRVANIMREPCITVHPDQTIQEVALLFADTGIQRAPVMVGDTLIGVISATDLIMKLDMGLQTPADILSRRIQEALLHTRVAGNQDDQIAQETAIAWKIREELGA